MGLKKNLGAKAVAIVGSFVALIAAWGLAHRNPPASASDRAAAGAAEPTASAGQRAAPGRAAATQAGQGVVKKTHTRTHVS